MLNDLAFFGFFFELNVPLFHECSMKFWTYGTPQNCSDIKL